MGIIKAHILVILIVTLLLSVILVPAVGYAGDRSNAISDLVLEKVAIPGFYHVGEPIYYDMKVYNPNPECTYYISRIWDVYPDGQVEEFITDGPLVLVPGSTHHLTQEYVYVVRNEDIVGDSVINTLSGTYINDCDGRGTLSVEVATTIMGIIGDYVWLDENGDGIQDANESGISGITIKLYMDGELLTTNITDSEGEYLFKNLFAGTYTVDVDDSTLPDGLDLTTPPEPRVVALGGGEQNLDVDFGYMCTGIIGDYVWLDENGDGIQDGTESGLSGVTVELNIGDELIATNVTDSTGEYLFIDLCDGTYTVDVDDSTLLDGLDLTTPPEPRVVALGSGEQNLDVDFGYMCTGIIGDYVWRDIDGDGLQDPGESGIPGVEVELHQGGELLTVSVTDSNGNYLFDGLCEGMYIVDVNDSALPEGMFLTTPPEPRNVDLDAGEVNLNVDFGFKLPCECTGVIGDYMWMDLDDDGIPGAGESGVSAIIVELYQDIDGDGVQDTDDNLLDIDMTGPNGEYLFTGLCEGDYIVTVNMMMMLPIVGIELISPPEIVVDLGLGEYELDTDFRFGPLYYWDNPWDDDCYISNEEISLAEWHWATNTPVDGHYITNAEISILEYEWATGDVCS